MKVAITMRSADAVEYSEARDAISHDWIRYLESFALTPILVPNNLSNVSSFLKTLNIEKLLLTGGDGLFSSGNATYPLRNETESACLSYAIDAGISVLGVCRGLHMINDYFGGALSVGHHLQLKGVEHLASSHMVTLTNTNEQIVVNSFHQDAVAIENLAKELKPFAVSEDKVVEGLKHVSYPIIAVQWHPERPSPSMEFDRILINEWLSQ